MCEIEMKDVIPFFMVVLPFICIAIALTYVLIISPLIHFIKDDIRKFRS